MAERSFDKVVRDLGTDFSALRDDLRKLTAVVTDLASDHADDTRSRFAGAVDDTRGRFSSAVDDTRGRVYDAVDKARSRFNDTADRFASQAGDASDRFRGARSEIEHRIERNPLTAVMIAIVGGLVIGALSRSRR